MITSDAGDGVYISEIRIENFRLFGAGNDTFVLPLKPGLTALVGENDGGKTAVIDALRLVLGTRDQELILRRGYGLPSAAWRSAGGADLHSPDLQGADGP